MIAIMSEAAGNKSVALETLRNELRLSSAGTIAFGDGLNDCAMLEWAGKIPLPTTTTITTTSTT